MSADDDVEYRAVSNIKKLAKSYKQQLRDKYEDIKQSKEYEPVGSSEEELFRFANASTEGDDWKMEQPPPPPKKVPYFEASENEKWMRNIQYKTLYDPSTTEGNLRRESDFIDNPDLYDYYGLENPFAEDINKPTIKNLTPEQIKFISDTFIKFNNDLSRLKRDIVDNKAKIKSNDPKVVELAALTNSISDFTKQLMNDIEIDMDFVRQIPASVNIYSMEDSITSYIAKQYFINNPASAAAGKKRISKKYLIDILNNKKNKSISANKQLVVDIFKILNS